MLDFREINRKPYLMFIWAFAMGSIGILIAAQISFRVAVSSTMFDLTGLFAVLFTIIPSVFFVTHLIKKEELLEEKFIREHKEGMFWQRHGKDIIILLFYFFGLTISFAVWSFLLPESFFQVQHSKIDQIQGVTGAATEAQQYAFFNRILLNNVQVMIFSFLFSFIFGAGAIFILAWNASILGVYVGGKLSELIWHIPGVTFWFIPHGVPEITGYVCAGLAGGMISAAVLRGHNFRILRVVILDSLKLLGLGIFSIIMGAGIESLEPAIQITFLIIFYSVFFAIIFKALAEKYSL